FDMPRLILIGVFAVVLSLATASTVLGDLVGGALPTTAFTYTSVTDNSVNMTGDGIRLKTKASINVKTTYSRVPVNPNFFFGWHYQWAGHRHGHRRHADVLRRQLRYLGSAGRPYLYRIDRRSSQCDNGPGQERR